ncbi:MAG: hypothetical protein ACRBBN_21825 [Methyloligellaceae bacterium]
MKHKRSALTDSIQEQLSGNITALCETAGPAHTLKVLSAAVTTLEVETMSYEDFAEKYPDVHNEPIMFVKQDE